MWCALHDDCVDDAMRGGGEHAPGGSYRGAVEIVDVATLRELVEEVLARAAAPDLGRNGGGDDALDSAARARYGEPAAPVGLASLDF